MNDTNLDTTALQSAIARMMRGCSRTNTTCITLSLSDGWRVSYTPSDMEDGATGVACWETLVEWAQDASATSPDWWTDAAVHAAAEWVLDNLGCWLADEEDDEAEALRAALSL